MPDLQLIIDNVTSETKTEAIDVIAKAARLLSATTSKLVELAKEVNGSEDILDVVDSMQAFNDITEDLIDNLTKLNTEWAEDEGE